MDKNTLYSIDDFQFGTLPEYLTASNKELLPRYKSERMRRFEMRQNLMSREETPDQGNLFKEFLSGNLIKIDSLKAHYKDGDMRICDIFSYKNKVLVDITFRAIYKDVQFIKELAVIDKIKRERKNRMALEEDDDNSNPDDDESNDSDGDNNDITRKDLFESIKFNARGNSEMNKNKIFGELPDNKRMRGSF